MAGFSAADAAFTGFRIVWERPWAVAIWAGVQFVLNLALQLFIVISSGSAIMQLSQLGLQPPQTADTGRELALIQQAAPTYVALIIAWLVIAAIFYAAMNRAVMRPHESRFGYLRLAGDELRQLGLLAALFGIFLALYLGVVIVAAILVTLLSVAAGEGVGVALGLAVILPAGLCGFVFLGVRLSLASPMTFATGRINLFGSWRLTQGRFWALLGTYVLAMALGLVVAALILVIAVLAVGIVGGGFGGIAAVMQADLTTPQALLTPARLVYLAITSIGAALSSPITLCPPPAIYRSIAGGGPGAVGKVFD